MLDKIIEREIKKSLIDADARINPDFVKKTKDMITGLIDGHEIPAIQKAAFIDTAIAFAVKHGYGEIVREELQNLLNKIINRP